MADTAGNQAAMPAQRQAVFVVLTDGSLTLYDRDGGLSAADVMREHPGYALGLRAEPGPGQYLLPAQVLRRGETYFLCSPWKSSQLLPTIPVVTLPGSESQPLMVTRNQSVASASLEPAAAFTAPRSFHDDPGNAPGVVPQARPARSLNRGLFRHHSASFSTFVQPADSCEQCQASSVVTADPRTHFCRPRRLIRHKSSSLASLAPAMRSSNYPPVASCGAYQDTPMRKKSTSLASLPASVQVPEPWGSRAIEVTVEICGRCFQIESSCLCTVGSPARAVEPSPRSVFPSWGYDQRFHADEPHSKELHSPKGGLWKVDEGESVLEFQKTKTLWRLDMKKPSVKYDKSQVLSAKALANVGCDTLDCASPGAPACMLSPRKSTHIKRIQRAVTRLYRWSSLPIKDEDLL